MEATVEELKALGHPVRWRILRLCLDRALTNKELSVELDLAPATTLRHVRALVKTNFLVAEPVADVVDLCRESVEQSVVGPDLGQVLGFATHFVKVKSGKVFIFC
ncbi:ArsR/SmtB family transcription factor [Kibdelosporangium lantanae]|uniref:ArsR/SmtB family transcription factor n=1 Tax=Kibdelosporangium lantanae TaxID=1497396 RepID=A0ABW3MJ40_9PSEU